MFVKFTLPFNAGPIYIRASAVIIVMPQSYKTGVGYNAERNGTRICMTDHEESGYLVVEPVAQVLTLLKAAQNEEQADD